MITQDLGDGSVIWGLDWWDDALVTMLSTLTLLLLVNGKKIKCSHFYWMPETLKNRVRQQEPYHYN